MKKIVLGIIIISILMLVGCNKVATNQVNTTTKQQEQSIIPASIPSSNSSNYVKKYKGETNKKIQYDKLAINFDDYHIVSDTQSDNSETFKCEIDNGVARPEKHMTITIQKIERPNFPDTESIVSYLSNMVPNYEKMRIYDHVTDNSGIVNLYNVTGGGQTNYIVCYRDACYSIQSDYGSLEIYLFEKDHDPNYGKDKLKIECANSFITDVNETIYYNNDELEKAKYDIIQGKDGTKYSAELSRSDEEYQFTLKNEVGDNLLNLSTYGDLYEMIKFLDVNMDGYADIQFLEQQGTFNNSYALYIWDNSAKNYAKVKCEEMLSELEVHDGYLLNWQKASADSGVKQKLVWKGNTLVKESEENYQIGN